jgi:hypothetical protein
VPKIEMHVHMVADLQNKMSTRLSKR